MTKRRPGGRPNRGTLGPGDADYRPPIGDDEWNRKRAPEFTAGNFANLRHGAKSPRIRDPLAAELVEQALEEVPYLSEPRYRAEVHAWASSEASCLLIERWIAENGPLDKNGDPRPALNQLVKFRGLAAKSRDALGLTPMAAAKLDALRERQAEDRSVIELEAYLSKKSEEDE